MCTPWSRGAGQGSTRSAGAGPCSAIAGSPYLTPPDSVVAYPPSCDPAPPQPRCRAPLPRSPPSARPRRDRSRLAGRRARGIRTAGIGAVRPTGGRRPQPRPRPGRPGRRLPARDDRRAPLRRAPSVRGLQQGPQLAADARAAVVPADVGPEPCPARGRHLRDAQGPRRRDPGANSPRRGAQLHRLGDAGIHRMVPGGPRIRSARSWKVSRCRACSGSPDGRAIAAITTWWSASSRPNCWRIARIPASSGCIGSCRGTGRTACWAERDRPNCGSASHRRSRRRTTRARCAGNCSRSSSSVASSCRWRWTACGASGSCCVTRVGLLDGAETDAAAAAAARTDPWTPLDPARAGVAMLAPLDPLVWDRDFPAITVRLRLPLGGLHPGAEAPVGLLRAAGPVGRPTGWPH